MSRSSIKKDPKKEVVSAKITSDLKRVLLKKKINVSATIRAALTEAANE